MTIQRLSVVYLGLLIVGVSGVSCTQLEPVAAGENIRVEFNREMESRLTAVFDGERLVLGPYQPSEYPVVNSTPVTQFELSESGSEPLSDKVGSGTRVWLKGSGSGLEKLVTVDLYDDFPGSAVLVVSYTNQGAEDLRIDTWVNHHYRLDSGQDSPAFWSYQGASHEDRRDWVLPLEAGYEEQNYLGMNASDYGGGTPVVDVWRSDVGVAVGHLEMEPKLNSLPVSMPDEGHAELSVRFDVGKTLKPGESLETFRTFVTLHEGDYFKPLGEYRRFMLRQGIEMPEFPDSTYEPIWCAWGYGRQFTMDQIYGTLPKVKELGLKWAVLDDGWQTAEGDWYLDPKKFPRGDSDMRKLTATMRESGARPKLWWVPLAADPETDLMKEHPEYALINKDGEHQIISWWDSYYLCPAYPPVREYTKNLVVKIFQDWDYDGLKIDGQHLNAVPPCFNESHNHDRPEAAVEAVPEFFKDIYDTALGITADAVVEICPCGTAYNFFSMPYMNQPVSSDPLSSWQIRLKGKTFKALMGRRVPYYGDHVELSDNADDFATTIGIGGVPGTKFTWPVGARKDSRIDLTPEKNEAWAKWLGIYEEKQLPRGNYLGELYDIGFDRPECHAIQKDDKTYYAFYAEDYSGEVELRGLEAKAYRVRDYVNGVDLATIQGPVGRIEVQFTRNLLLEVVPE